MKFKMPLKKKDFIEIEFTARIKGGDIFDSNVKEDLKNSNLEADSKPFIFSLGEGMFRMAHYLVYPSSISQPCAVHWIIRH